MKKIFLLLCISVLILNGTYAQDSGKIPVKLTLEDCLRYALKDNYTRQSVQLDETSTELTFLQSRMERLPNLSANLSENVSDAKNTGTGWNGNYDLSANMTLFQGGQINNTIKQNQLRYEQTQLRTSQYDNELSIQVLQSFLTALGNEELLKYQESILIFSEQQVEEGRARFQAGQILESDYLLLEAQYATDLNNITTTRISKENGLIALKNLMAMDLSQPVELVYPADSLLKSMLIIPTQEEVVERGMETLPDIRISEYNVEIAETGLKISKSTYYPTISLSGSIGTGHIQNYNNFGTQLSDRFVPQAGINISIPIYNRNKAKTNVKQSRIALQQAELERNQSFSNIQQTLINEYGNVVSSASKFRTAEIKQNAYLSSFNAYGEMFRAGSITTVELLQQQNNYISALNDYIQNKYTFILQRKVLDIYMGN